MVGNASCRNDHLHSYHCWNLETLVRIISPHRDYYDSIMSQGHDDTVIYQRKPEILLDIQRESIFKTNLSNPLLDKFYPLSSGSHWSPRSGKQWKAEFENVTVLLAGKAYGGVRVHLSSITGLPSQKSDSFYDRVSLEAHLISHGIATGGFEYKRIHWYRNEQSANRSVSEQLNFKAFPMLDLAIEFNAPVLVCLEASNQHVVVLKNTNLKEMQFYKVMDPFTTFQEIDMFISGIMAPENRPMVQIADKYKIQEHGFDKFSFRKPKEK